MMKQASSRSMSSALLGIALLLWLGVALLIGASGVLAHAPLPPPAIAFGLTALVLLMLWLMPALRERLRAIGPAPLVAVHAIRMIVGLYFLRLYGQGVLPGAFALPAGWGDGLVGGTALLVLWLCVPVRTSAQRWGVLLWNAVGLVDIVLVLSNGVRLFLGNAGLAAPFTALPLALLPLFVIPVVLVSHVLLFVWVGGQKAATA